MINFDTAQFIKKIITKRQDSLFLKDIEEKKDILSREIENKKILVIGGAGTIGSSFIKAVLPFRPSSLIVVDFSENGLTELTRDLRSQNIFIPNEYITYPFDFGSDVFEKMFNVHQFNVIACFAAHKHVRSEKDHLAIEAMIRNNVFNTEELIKLALKKPPQHFFSVSTDKAANPVNVMGASKKLMEKVLLTYSKDIKITTARFANVAFSNGSLLAGFIDRIFKKQPLSSPKDVKRYFVSPEESGQLCMLACFLGNSGDIFFPKLDETQMMTFSEIAEAFLLELGLQPDYSISESEAKEKAEKWQDGKTNYPVYFFESDTSGEKKFEEFYTLNDIVEMDRFKKLGVVKNQETIDKDKLNVMLSHFRRIFDDQSTQKSTIVDLLSGYLHDFKHVETGKSLDQKM